MVQKMINKGSIEFYNKQVSSNRTVNMVKEGLLIIEPHLSKSTHISFQLTVSKGGQIGKGLGKHLQGTFKGLKVTHQIDNGV